jgi:outer membrane lipoprotein carrier protein
MKIIHRIFILFLLFLAPVLAKAESASAQLIQILDHITSLQTRFIQTVYSGGKKNILQQTSGVMSLQRPGKFRWQVFRPSEQLLIADGRRVWFYDEGLAQVTVQKQQSENQNSPAMLLSGSSNELTRNFTITGLSTSDTEQRYKLVPKIKNSLFQAVILDFQHNELHGMRIVDSLGQSTVVMFSHVKTNPALPAKLFHFVVPKGVDVVEG